MPTFSRAASTATRNQRPPPPPPLSDLAPPSPANSQQPCRFKASPRLSRWSLARAVRSARKLDRQVQKTHTLDEPNTGSDSGPYDQGVGMLDKYKNDNVNGAVQGSDGEDDGEVTVGKQIYLVSDGTGWTAEHSVNAALVLFEHFLVDRGCAVNTHLFSGIDDVERLMEIVKQAAKEGAMLVYTLADPAVADSVRQACKVWGVPSTDILSPIIEATASHLGVSPWGTPRGTPGRSNALSDEHFRRIEAVEFTIKQDDGALPQNLHQADIILVGVSRIGKTPLSIYLAQKGYKVANVPIVMGVDLPKSLFELEQENVFGLTINPVVLQMRRRARAMKLGFGDDVRSNYSEMDHVRNELEFAAGIFAQNPTWPVIEITGKGIEETAAVVLRLYHDRKQKCFMPRYMPRISKCY